MSEEFVDKDELIAEGADEAPSVDQPAEPANPTENPAAEEAQAVAEVDQLQALVNERTEDLQRLQAEYVNYRKRVERDRAQAKQAGIESVMIDLMPVMDSLALAREHGDVEGGFKLVADEFEKVTNKHGLVMFGEVGEEFDPNLHDALMQQPLDEPVSVPTISQVMQPGYRLNDRVLRPARVAVAQPDNPDA